MFREPEKRPPGIVSNTFTLLVILPLVIFIVMVKKTKFVFKIRFSFNIFIWYQVSRLGINFSSLSFSLSALGFHLSIGGT